MELACATGVSPWEWLKDPVAMITAQTVLAEQAEEIRRGR